MENQNPALVKELEEVDALLAELERRKRYKRLDYLFPDEGPLRRELYHHACKFFAAGAQFRERCLIAGNQVGKSLTVGTEVTYHLTGRYPHWWLGKRFDHPTQWVAAGIRFEDTRAVIQQLLFGDFGDIGSGLIPKEDILEIVRKGGAAEMILLARIQWHDSNGRPAGVSKITLKAYEQGRTAFQGFRCDGYWMDEEPPAQFSGIKDELSMRVMISEGIGLFSFTPLFGLTDTVKIFLPGGKMPPDGINPETGTWAIAITWWDVPHMTPAMIERELAKIPAWQRDARSKGIPTIGRGAIYPIDDAQIRVEPFLIPDYWPRVFAMDVGLKVTAVAWFAQDPNSGVWYLYDEYYAQGFREPPIHAEAIKGSQLASSGRAPWIPGVVDPAANRRRDDGTTLFNQYRELGLDLIPSKNHIQAGISRVFQMLSCDQLKVFSNCKNWFDEKNCYCINERGEIPVEQADHLMDVTRYFALTGQNVAMRKSNADDDEEAEYYRSLSPSERGANKITGY